MMTKKFVLFFLILVLILPGSALAKESEKLAKVQKVKVLHLQIPEGEKEHDIMAMYLNGNTLIKRVVLKDDIIKFNGREYKTDEDGIASINFPIKGNEVVLELSSKVKAKVQTFEFSCFNCGGER
jgi:hypothetical protein